MFQNNNIKLEQIIRKFSRFIDNIYSIEENDQIVGHFVIYRTFNISFYLSNDNFINNDSGTDTPH